jgi:hypothetical protein
VVLLLIGVFIAWLILEIFHNKGIINSISWLWHSTAATNRGMLSGMILYLFFKDGLIAFKWWLIFNTAWWFLFDSGLNFARNMRVFYVGSGSIDLAVKALAKRIKFNHEILMLTCKLMLLGLVIAFSFYLNDIILLWYKLLQVLQ